MPSRFAFPEVEFVWDQDQDQRTVKSDTPVGQQTLTAFGDDEFLKFNQTVEDVSCANRISGTGYFLISHHVGRIFDFLAKFMILEDFLAKF